MSDFYKPFSERALDSQYRDRLAFILHNGEMVKETPQGVGALTCFGTLPSMIFDLSNGAPIITDRSIKGFWKKPVAEMLAFINGVRTIPDMVAAGCDFWDTPRYHANILELGLDPGDLGAGSYGAAFHDFPMPNGKGFNQYESLVQQLREYPHLRTHFISPWIPFYIPRGNNRKVVVAPCHGWQHFRVINGRLHLQMTQRAADFPIGVPSNLVQYAAVLLMVAYMTGYKPGTLTHVASDAHIYEDQIDAARELVKREPLPLPTLQLVNPPDDLFAFTADNFELTDYHPHPAMKGIPFQP